MAEAMWLDSGHLAVWFRVARRPDIVGRSLRVALVVGTVLVAINHGDLFLSGNWRSYLLWKVPLTYCVPFAVSTYAAVSADLSAGGGRG